MENTVKKLSAGARVWIYQAGKKLTESERKNILDKAKYFVANWSAHGSALNADAEILYDTFLVLMVDEGDIGASGCSIDKSLHFIQQLEQEFHIDFLNRKIVALLEKGMVKLVDLESLKSQINEGKIDKDSIIFNNLVSTAGQMETDWKIPLNKSWLQRYLPEN